MMTVTLILVLISSFFTDIIGIHPIFGGFLAGLIIPKDNGFAISVVEKVEDFVCLLLLPQYFTLSGLRTNLGLLNNGITWGYTVLICVVAFFAKLIPCSVTAKIFGFTARESGAIGALMACKGLVELIVLNVGYQAGILDQRVFSMFVLHAIVLTFITTPLTLLLYPPRYRVRASTASEGGMLPGAGSVAPVDEIIRSKFAVILDSMEQLPPAMTLTQLLKPLSTSVRPSLPMPEKSSEKFSEKSPAEKSSQSEASVIPYSTNNCTVCVDAIRLVEWTERTSGVLKSQSVDTLIRNDAILSIFRTFGRLNNFSMSSFLSVLSYDEFPTHVANHVRERGSQMVIIPWSLASHDVAETRTSHHTGLHPNPFDFLFSKPPGKDEAASLLLRSQFIRRVFASSPSDVALVIDRGLSTESGSTIFPHLFLPFFGGPDDRIALSFVIQLCMHEAISATVVRMHEAESDGKESVISVGNKSMTNAEGALFPNTVYSQQ